MCEENIATMNKAIFWDLLGTLGGNSHTLINNDFVFFDEAILALQKATDNNFLNIIITNQSHIAHNRITLDVYNASLKKLLATLQEKSITITEIYTCPHAKKDNCQCKKPRPLLISKAITKYKLDPTKCFIIGDSGKNDMMLAKNSNIRSILVLTGDGIKSLTDYRHLWNETKPTHIAENSLDAIEKILRYS